MSQTASPILLLSWCSSTLNIQPFFCGFLLARAYDRAASRPCTWCRRPQRDHEYVTALFQASHHSESDRNHFERPNSLFHMGKSGTVELCNGASCWLLEQALLLRHAASTGALGVP